MPPSSSKTFKSKWNSLGPSENSSNISKENQQNSLKQKEEEEIVNRRVRKKFHGRHFNGIIKCYDPEIDCYRIVYEDGDEEDMTLSEAKKHMKVFENFNNDTSSQHASTTPKDKGKSSKKKPMEQRGNSMSNITKFLVPRQQIVTAPSRYGRVRAQVNYAEPAELAGTPESFSEEEETAARNVDSKQPKKPSTDMSHTKKRKVAGAKKEQSIWSKKQKTSSKVTTSATESSSEFSDASSTNDISSTDEELASEPDDDDTTPPKKVKRKRVSAASKTNKSPSNTNTKKNSSSNKATGTNAKKISMAEAFQPMNNPLFQRLSRKEIAAQKLFLDPCGQEATDDIIGSLMGQQVEKVKLLLHNLFSSLSAESPIGTLDNPLTLGTACSGTDAPALALAMIQEQYQLRCAATNDNRFHYQHVFSCENDPFKQAYLARNFDSILYPDITKLVTNDPNVPPIDVYGQSQVLPKANVFVAGTSCKNFSMLLSKFRIDIEDKGCSGETFLAACEVLFQEKPQYAILENVTGAPWEKMAEYITGRVVLKHCDNSKAIKEIQKNKKQDLEFTYDETNDKIVVHQVPAVYGVRCKSTIQGYQTPGSTSIKPVLWPKSKKKDAKCTLMELMRENKINKQTDTLVFHMPVTYCTHCVKVDSKDYGVPQTRQRTYMFVWQPTKDKNGNADIADDLGTYWEALVKHLKSPVRHSLEAFILQVDHDIIRVFREALRGPPGRQSKRAAFQIPDFWTSASKNLEHNKNARQRSGIQDMARPITQWGPFGKKHLPPHYWLEYLNCQEHRQLDMIDILHISAARDAESHDSNFSSFFWNISQNASKEKHRTATSGIAGCITPGGDVFLPHLGRPLLGCEKLLLQGIPYFSLALGNESEVQLSDLAGNAMTLTTVGATLLAAITCKQLRKETLQTKHKDMNLILKQQTTPSIKANLSIPKHEELIEEASEGQMSISDLFAALSKVASEAVISSIWCTCETSGQNSNSKVFLTCLCCRISSCRECCGSIAGYQLDGHDVHEVSLEKRTDVGTFENKLRNIVPPLLIFNKEGIEYIASNTINDRHRVKGLAGAVLSLHKIRRQRRKWVITYYVRDDLNQAVAEFRVTVGEISTASAVLESGASQVSFPVNKLGVLGEFTSFIPAKTAPLVYGLIEPCMYKQVLLNPNGTLMDETDWMAVMSDPIISTLKVEGFDPMPSFRVEMGLTDDADRAIRTHVKKPTNKASFEKASQLGETRRFLYTDNWKEWPGRITISTSHDQVKYSIEEHSLPNISGTYHRVPCRNTVAQSGLWIRNDCVPTLYLLIKPDISRNGPDTVIISTSLNHEETTCIIAYFPMDWQPCDALNTKLHTVKGVKYTKWSSVSAVKCIAPKSKIEVSGPSGETNSKGLLSISGFSESEIEILCRGSNICGEGYNKLNFQGSQSAQQCTRIFNSLCVAPILKYAAVHGLMYDMKPDAAWLTIEQEQGLFFGCCTNTIPCRPEEHWYYDDERECWERRSEPGASRRYYLALQNAPQTFEFIVNKNEKTLQINVMPEVACHHAAYNLITGRGQCLAQQVAVEFRLSCLLSQADPMLDSFKVYSCDGLLPTDVELKNPHKLYLRQQKALAKMLAIEHGKTEFEEIEMSEHEMPGATGWSVTSKAKRVTPICGGVIADAIGAGKTVVSIAIILRGLESARLGRSYPRKSSATLVVVPPGLIDQWKSEINKFSTSLTVICIYDFDYLSKVRVKSIIEADVVLCPVDILESEGYLENLIKKSGRPDEGTPKLPRYVGQTEISGAKGVWIPHTSNDPYGGGNNPNNQKRRNESARYTFVYLNAIKALRSLNFDKESKSTPLEYFEWERVIVDEIHECLCTSKDDIKLAKEATSEGDRGFFQEKNRRAGRELLGVTTKDKTMRPLVFRKSIFGLTGTPLLDSPNRVIELANLMGNTYVIGLSSHWRKLERESSRDIFLHNFLEPKTSREIRRNIYEKCQQYLSIAACRNKSGEEMAGIELCEHRRIVNMSKKDGEAYLKSQNGIPPEKQSYAIRPEDFDASSGHDISVFLRQNANLECRSMALRDLCQEILSKDPTTKIVVFCDGRIAAGLAAADALKCIGCTFLARDDTVQQKNKKIAWYQHADVTEEDKKRPRILVLNFEHAAGLNLQSECYNLILFTPLYIGVGGSTDDPVWDASTELQAIGRVYRPGQPHKQVNVYRIEVISPGGEDCLDSLLIRRNTDKETVEMAVNTSD